MANLTLHFESYTTSNCILLQGKSFQLFSPTMLHYASKIQVHKLLKACFKCVDVQCTIEN